MEIDGIRLVNLCTQTMRFFLPGGGGTIEVPPSGITARVEVIEDEVGYFCGIPLVRQRFSPMINHLPDPVPGVVYLVSTMVLQACPGRDDLLAPNTGPRGGVRGPDGQIHGVTSLVCH